MAIFQPTIVRNGEKHKANTYSIRFRTASGKLEQENGFRSRDEAAVRLRDAKREVKEELAGIRTSQIKQNEIPLSEHLDDFQKSLEDRDVSDRQVRLVAGRLRSAFDACHFRLLSDLQVASFQAHLARQREAGKSQQTLKHLVRHAKQFSNYLLEEERVEAAPFQKLRPPKVTERKHQRRALASMECDRIREAARVGQSMFEISGCDREALYLMALNTGFRASELSRLVVSDLKLDHEYPHVSLSASNTKNREEARIPIRAADVVQFLKRWVKGKPRNAKLWPGNWASSRKAGKMLQRDLKEAGIPYDVDGRKADFHALRYTFITNLIKAEVSPAYVQRLARHSDVNLTLRVYTDLGLEDLYHGRVETSSGNQRARTKRDSKKGSDRGSESVGDDGSEAESVALNVAPVSGSVRPEVSQNVSTASGRRSAKITPESASSSPETQEATGFDSSCRSVSQNVLAERGGFEPPVPFPAHRFSRPAQSAALSPLRLHNGRSDVILTTPYLVWYTTDRYN